ncbi:hypothetical protein MRQ36_19025 [Micromonospora sp. R77]|uniref:hypothetical protein n=1 Tax=Micromonospora sp. R77 TaxID=2925836 RepID=UPI001F6199C5|nr:hypothetical protein [Micromonospora sp. R77]MCI4064555.1 hypothetical protein [Micromonospora sp. R77]
MAEQDRARVDEPAPAPNGPTRSALRRLARARQRRRLAVEALIAVVALTAVVAYLGTEQHAAPREESAVLPGPPSTVGRPSPGPGANASPGDDLVTPGLRPRQRPPSPSPSPTAVPSTPAVEPLLTVTRADVPALVDLTAAGTVDWVHWGLLGATTPVRKRTGSGEIRDEGGRGARESFSTNPEAYAWRDGAPVGAASGTTAGVQTCGKGNGFVLSVAADGAPRTVRLYVGLWAARARLDVRLSTGGPTSSMRLEDPHTQHTAEFTVRFRAPKGAKLQVSWTVEESFGDCGTVGLQAAALR